MSALLNFGQFIADHVTSCQEKLLEDDMEAFHSTLPEKHHATQLQASRKKAEPRSADVIAK